MLQFSVVLAWKHNVLVCIPCVHTFLIKRVMVCGSSTRIVIVAATLYRAFVFSDDEEETKRVVRSQKDKR